MPETSIQDPSTLSGCLLLVTSRAEPYWRDIPDILALPTGAGFHFRYDLGIVPRGVLADIRKLKGRVGCLVYLDSPVPPPGGQDSFEYLPLRACEVVDAKVVGSYVRVDFVLRELVTSSTRELSGPNPNSTAILALISQAKCKVGFDGHYLIDTKGSPFPTDDSLENWTNVIKELERFPTHHPPKPTVFLWTQWTGTSGDDRIGRFKRKLGIGNPPSFDKNGRLMMRSGEVYRLHVVQFVPSNDADGREVLLDQTKFPITLKLATDGMVIRTIVSTTVVRGAYDDGYLDVGCAPVTASTYSFIRLGLESDSHYFHLPLLRFDDAEVKGSRRIPATAALVGALFVVGAFVSPILSALASHGVHTSQDWAPWITGSLQGLAGLIVVFLSSWLK